VIGPHPRSNLLGIYAFDILKTFEIVVQHLFIQLRNSFYLKVKYQQWKIIIFPWKSGMMEYQSDFADFKDK
jgi:hypothetical protein